MSEELAVTGDEVVAWLKTLDPETVLGEGASYCGSCPVALYLRAHGFPEAVVSLAGAELDGWRGERLLGLNMGVFRLVKVFDAMIGREHTVGLFLAQIGEA